MFDAIMGLSHPAGMPRRTAERAWSSPILWAALSTNSVNNKLGVNQIIFVDNKCDFRQFKTVDTFVYQITSVDNSLIAVLWFYSLNRTANCRYFVDFVYSSPLDQSAVSRRLLQKWLFSEINRQNGQQPTMVRSRRLELPRVAPQRPQRCASTNSATTALGSWDSKYPIAKQATKKLVERAINLHV